MLEKVRAVVVVAEGKSIICSVAGLEIRVIANAAKFRINSESEIFTYLHWSQDMGPVLFGFSTEEEKQAFKVLIDCPKVGPSLAMNILMQMSPHSLFGLICREDEIALAKINGVGPKCAKNLVAFLHEKARLFLQNYKESLGELLEQDVLLFDVREALLSLGYSSSEIAKMFVGLGKSDIGGNFDQILRSALRILQKK